MSYSSFGSHCCQLLHSWQVNSNALHCIHLLFIYFQQKDIQDMHRARGKSNIKASSPSSSLLKKKKKNFSVSLASLRNAEQYHSRQLRRSRKTSRIKPDSETWALRKVSQTAIAACFFSFPQHFAPTAKRFNLYKSCFRGTVHKLPNRRNAGLQ